MVSHGAPPHASITPRGEQPRHAAQAWATHICPPPQRGSLHIRGGREGPGCPAPMGSARSALLLVTCQPSPGQPQAELHGSVTSAHCHHSPNPDPGLAVATAQMRPWRRWPGPDHEPSTRCAWEEKGAAHPGPSSPERDADGDVAVNGDGQETEDGALREDQDEAGKEETAVAGSAEPYADGDSEGDGKDPHCDVGSRQ